MSAPLPESTVRRPWLLGFLVALVFLCVALPVSSSYGATWDCVMGEYPYGERLLEFLLSGDERFLPLEASEPRPTVRAPHPDFDVGRFAWYQVYPLGALSSAISCRLLWTETGLVPALQAHNLAVQLFAAGLALVLVRFLAVRVGALAAVAAGIFLVGSPRFFAHAMTNLKDIPETALYTTAMLLGFVALTRGGLRWYLLTGAVTGLALAQKQNALFVPPQLAVFLALVLATPSLRRSGAVRWSTSGFLLGGLLVLVVNFAVSPRYWVDPIDGPLGRLGEMMRMGNTGLDAGSAVEVGQPLYAPLYVLTTTPPVLLVLALVGLIGRQLSGTLRAFLLAGLLVPVGRNMLPGMRNFDGIRHFLEFYPFLCAAAGAGLAVCVAEVRSRWNQHGANALAAVALALPVVETIRTHPNGICYFNSIAGGLEGAQARAAPTATDYWGNSYWQAFAWLEENAEPDARVLVPVATHVARSIAPVRLREDLRLWRSSDTERDVVYVVYITRRAFYTPFVHELERRKEPVHEIQVQGGTILRIYRIGPDADGEVLLDLWRRRISSRSATRRIRKWLERNPAKAREAWAIVHRLPELGVEEAAAQVRELLPVGLHDGLEGVIWNLHEE